MKICGLTGGIGMGKSTAAGFFSQLGARVTDTDDIARQLVQPGQPALAEIQTFFGKAILTEGELNRAKLAKIIFADSVARKKLEDILHPKIRRHWQSQIEKWSGQNCPLAIVVIPLLFETQAENCFEKIICVACSSKTQNERLAARNWDDEQIRQRIAAQMPVEEKMNRSHFVLWTEGALETASQQASKIFERL